MSLKTRVVLALAIVILVIQAIYVLLEDRRFAQRLHADMQATADNLAQLYAGAVANSVWEYDREAATAQIQAMRVIKGFAAATIREPNGNTFAAIGVVSETLTEDMAGSQPTVAGRADIKVDARDIAEITVTLSLAPLEDERAAYLRTLIVTNGAIAAALLGLTLLALHLVTRPLDRMTSLMQQFSGGDLSAEVPFTDRDDEIGRMARALEVFRDNAVERKNAEESLQRRSAELATLN
ncbi:MAG: HAMP domain-containing protein, partial [Rhodospirillaceae bacterium]|nr:HAMP domain-containing protein [Rhodospirillaceae bacterium]